MDKLSRSEFALFLYYYLRRIKIDSPKPNLKDAFESYKKNSKITQEKLINDYNIDHPKDDRYCITFVSFCHCQ